jgi:hypothetical protein
MMKRQMFLVIALVFAIASTTHAVVIGDFETGLDGWWSDDATISQTATGATTGSSALQVDSPGTWKQAAKMDAKPYRTLLGSPATTGAGATISMDITMAAAGTDGTWQNAQIVINGQSNDDNGANNNIGWVQLSTQDIVRDGAAHTYSWSIDSALADKIAATDDSIGWFELVLVSNNDANDVSFQVDNVQINEPPSNVVIGNFETGLDGWGGWDGVTLSQSATGATVGSMAMQSVDTGGWRGRAIDAHPWRQALGSGVFVSMDITAFAADITGNTWENVELVINGQNNDDNGANNNLDWNSLGSQDIVRDGAPHTYTWSINPILSEKIAATDDSISWFELVIVTNNDGTANKIYVDNIQIFKPEQEEPVVGVVVGDFETDLDGWWLAGDATATLTPAAADGVTKGSGALKIQDGNGWKMTARLDGKGYMAILGSPGAKITMDVTALPGDMTNDWLNVGMVINADNGGSAPENNVGWNDLGQQSIPVDGQAYTLEWTLSDGLIEKIAGANSGTIWWFELVIIMNSNGGTFYVDNVQVYPRLPAAEYPYGVLIGDFELGLDNWSAWDAAFTRTETGATRGTTALQSVVPGNWHGHGALNAKSYLEMFGGGAAVSADITIFPADYIANWGNMEMVLNCQNDDGNGANNNIGWRSLGTVNPIVDGKPHTYIWRLPADLQRAVAGADQSIGWFELVFITNNDTTTTTVYLDNMWIFIPEEATYPDPVNGGGNVVRDPTMRWVPGGGEPESHDVYFGTDRTEVTDVDRDTLASYPDVLYGNTAEAMFAPGKLDLVTTYYWRVDEYVKDGNDISIVKGNVWSFTTSNYMALDDFESYTDRFDLMAAWPDANELVTDPVHGGSQAMKALYDNTKAPYYTEISYDVPAELADMTQQGIKGLNLYFGGDPNNQPESIYLVLEDAHGVSEAVKYDGDASNLTRRQWSAWELGLTWFNVDLTDITSVTLVIGDLDNPTAGSKGVVYLDDVRLYQGQCLLYKRTADFVRTDYAPLGLGFAAGDCEIGYGELLVMAGDWLKTDAILPTSGDPNAAGGLVAYYKFDEGIGSTSAADSTGDASHVGTINNGVTYVTPGYDGTGSAVNFTGDTRVSIGTWDPTAGTGAFSVSAWIRWNGNQATTHQGIIGKRNAWSATDAMSWFFEINVDGEGSLALRQFSGANTDVYSATHIVEPFIGKWAHVAATFDGTTGRIYLNGQEVASGPFVLADKPDANFGIGNTHGGGGGETFRGDIDEVQVYNRALSAQEAAYLADMTKGDGQLIVPIASVADLSSTEPAGQKSINLKDFAVLASYWLNDQIWPY